MDGLLRKNSEKRWKLKRATLCKFIIELTMRVNHWQFPFFPCCREEIDFMLSCCDTNHDGKIDYIEFTERFHNPAKEIGFNLAVLLTNLSEHMPSDPR